MKRTFLILTAVLGLITTSLHAKEDVFFAFDDHSIPWRANLKLTMVQARKHPGNPVLTRGPEGAPDHGHALIYGSVLRIDGKFRMWYLGMSQTATEHGQAPGFWRPMCYAESDDGVKWTKPELGLVDFNGSKQNNICLVESEVYSLTRVDDFLSVMFDPDEPDPARRYKCAYIAHMPFEEVRGGRSAIGPDEKRWGSFVCATSADGLRWKVVGDRPANAGGERFEVSGLYRFNGFYYAIGQLLSPWAFLNDGRDVGRCMLTYRSGDFEHWSGAKALGFVRPGQAIAQPVPGQQTHMGAGLWNRGNVMLGLYGQWQDGPKERPKDAKSHLWGTRIDLGFIMSNDGIHFREPEPDFKTIPRGKDDEWDGLALLQAHAFANVGDETYIWYSHWDIDGLFRNQDIGLATLRRDGFGYLSAQKTDAPAMCETASFETGAKGMKLFVNVDGVSADKPMQAELLDERALPLAGFSGADAAEVAQAGMRTEIVWKTALPRDRKLSLRLRLPGGGEGKLYALYVTKN
jgi:hypothetical protein